MRINFLPLLAFFLLITFSCHQPQTGSTAAVKQADTLHKVPKLPVGTIDTSGLSIAPIKIIKISLTSKMIDTVDKPEDNLQHEGHFGRYITIKVKYKNVSSKRIIGARLDWLIVDKNNKPAFVDSIRSGHTFGYMGTIAPTSLEEFSFGIGKTLTDEWQYDSTNGTRISLAYPSKVQFYDHSTWSIGKK